MTHTEKRTISSVLPFLPKEPGLLAHVHRVAALAGRAAERAAFTAEHVEAAYLAGLLHHYRDEEGDNNAGMPALWTAMGLKPPPVALPLFESAREVLRAMREPDGEAAEWTAMVEAANVFDEQMENLPYEEASTAAAIQELCDSGMVPEAFANALGGFRVVSPEELRADFGKFSAFECSADSEVFLRRSLRALNLNSLWNHSLEVADSANALARETGHSNPTDARLAGLVHDIGRIAYSQAGVDAEVKEWEEYGFPLSYAEFLVSGTDHATLGADFLRTRNFPEGIAEGVEFHHRPELTASPLAALLYLTEEDDEHLPSCARDHLSAKRLSSPESRQTRAAGRL